MNKLKQIFLDWTILKRVLVTLVLILLFRLGTLITLPGASISNAGLDESGSFLSLLNLLGGGGLSTFSIFALGVTPYITASIIIQLLSTDVVPPLARLNKQGEKGRIRLEKITRITAVLLAIIQAIAISLALISTGYVTLASGTADWVYIMMYTIILVAGSMLSIWIADQITMYGIGNGTSMIILVGILGSLPYKLSQAWSNIVINGDGISAIMFFIFYIILFLMVIMFIAFFEKSERRIPIQQTGRGLNLMRSKQTYMPLKVNPAGVIPVIFASALLTLPPTMAQFFPDTSPGKYWVVQNFSLSAPFGLTIYAMLVFMFTIFYSHININSEETSQNFQKQSTFIIGVKPGAETEMYISKTVTALSIIGAFYLTFVAIIPYLLGFVGVPNYLGIGGTSTIIMVSVAIDTWSQLNARIIAAETKHLQTKKTVKKDSRFRKQQPKDSKAKSDSETILFN